MKRRGFFSRRLRSHDSVTSDDAKDFEFMTTFKPSRPSIETSNGNVKQLLLINALARMVTS